MTLFVGSYRGIKKGRVKMIFESKVPGHVGPCKKVWLNPNQYLHRIDGGVTGFFRNVKEGFFKFRTGEEFHGIIKKGDGCVRPSEG